MAGRKYGTYFNLRRQLSNYQSNAYNVKVDLPRLKLPSEEITDSDINNLKKQLAEVKKKIQIAGRIKIREIQKQNKITADLNSPLLGSKPEFNIVQRFTRDIKQRQAEYERMRKSLNSSYRYYKNKYGVELERLPKLPKDAVPTKRQLQRIKNNVDEMKRTVRKGVREEEIIFFNVENMIQEAMSGDIWERYKAEQMHRLLLVPYQHDKMGTAKKIRTLKEKIDGIVERFLFIAYETIPDLKNSTSSTMTTEAWDLIAEALK